MLESLAADCRRFTFALSRSPEPKDYHDHPLKLSRDNFVPLPWLPSLAGGFHKICKCRKAIRELESRSHAVIAQLPFETPLALLGPTRPRVYHVCADIESMARNSPLYRGYKRLPALLVGRTIDRIHRRLIAAPGARVVTNGSQLRQLYGNPPGQAVVSTTILEKEIMSVARQRPTDAPFSVLYVGFMRQAKGIDTLLDAFGQVLNELPDAHLVIVGPQDKVDPAIMEYLDRTLEVLRRKGSVELRGHVNFGPELFQCFADADVLVLPSRSEGTPRVLVEARAFGCPVIGSNVGGIPTSIEDEVDGLLVPPDDVQSLKAAILRVARDRELRQRLVAGGIARARRSTIESFCRVLAEEAAQLVVESPAR